MTGKEKSSIVKKISTQALAFAMAASIVSPMATARAEEGKLTYLTWSGYELPEYDEAYLKAHPGAVDISVFGDDDDAFTKLKAGFRLMSRIRAMIRSSAGTRQG
ncbi:hypothetical protein [Acetobacter papayae]|uniref:hypothetical protein n=1 Tax=Acetobacter papayae TaxID=1076592 RepID=UPI00190102E1|nr:hypothetical protein [Acetobacter papayae]